MENQVEYIAKPLWRWIFLVPFGFMAAYSVWRQEMNPNLPALINIVSDWHWSVWVLIILLVVVAIVIEGLWRYNRSISKTTDHDYTNSVQTNLATGSVIANKISNSPISIQYQTEPTKLSPPRVDPIVKTRKWGQLRWAGLSPAGNERRDEQAKRPVRLAFQGGNPIIPQDRSE